MLESLEVPLGLEAHGTLDNLHRRIVGDVLHMFGAVVGCMLIYNMMTAQYHRAVWDIGALVPIFFSWHAFRKGIRLENIGMPILAAIALLAGCYAYRYPGYWSIWYIYLVYPWLVYIMLPGMKGMVMILLGWLGVGGGWWLSGHGDVTYFYSFTVAYAALSALGFKFTHTIGESFRITIQTMNELRQVNEQLEELACLDSLTGALTRWRITQELGDEIIRSERYGRPVSVVLFDLDNFKQINDRYGHPVGDEVLKQTIAMVKNELRHSDRVGRWGGEEFFIVLPETDLAGARNFAERLRRRLSSTRYDRVGTVTASFGVASHTRGETLADLVNRVDTLLYKAKREGKNQVGCQDASRMLGTTSV